MTYSCTSCGYRSAKWMGFCPQCRAAEGLVQVSERKTRSMRTTQGPIPLAKAGGATVTRAATGIGEIDRVLGGGFVPGAVVLLGGEPGVGKSTLVLQTAGSLSAGGSKVLIATAEESAEQIGLRAERLEIEGDEVYLLAEADVDDILGAADRLHPDLLVVDSIQTVMASEIGSAPGSVSQVRECAARVMRYAKDSGTTAILVGHVTKDGGIAGPKMLEHMVDVVLYLEGESESGLRGLRSLKNRFGATHLMGFFEMAQEGLREVVDPSAAFLADWRGAVPGTLAFPTVEGRRPVLVEVQALASPTRAPQPRRSVRGVEPSRVHQMLAILDRHAKLSFSDQEVYVNVVGGLRLTEPATDLPVALALASSLLDRPLGPLASWGEVGLTGELRAVAHETRRVEEAARLGIPTTVAPHKGTRLGICEALDMALPGWQGQVDG
ncbi:MAG: DNA repair protein RadA [Acidimicrobiia bacterium]|nr:DNA repair protein RadA [Acidimicrobiia bacterium]MDH5615621.1 DNA repair protein RadA [Acidimicrobiia bacterium]